ncbi:hypothetical protein HPB47_022766, partial [Ixodes persulcatus]
MRTADPRAIPRSSPTPEWDVPRSPRLRPVEERSPHARCFQSSRGLPSRTAVMILDGVNRTVPGVRAGRHDMATLSLKISVPENKVIKTIQFDPGTVVYDACRVIRDKVPDSALGD